VLAFNSRGFCGALGFSEAAGETELFTPACETIRKRQSDPDPTSSGQAYFTSQANSHWSSRGTKVGQDSETFEYHQGRIVHDKCGVVQLTPDLMAMPKAFVASPPFGDGTESLPLIERMGEVGLRKWYDAHARDLDDGNSSILGVDHNRACPDRRKRLAVVLVLLDQTGGRGLRAIKDGGDQLVAQQAGEGELRLG
jgi:hypothetical protein